MKKATIFSSWVLALAIGLAVAAPVQAQHSELTLQFAFCEQGGPGTAVGYVTFDLATLNNPPDYGIEGEGGIELGTDPEVLDLQVVVTNADAQNGSFDINDFREMVFNFNGGAPNYAAELIGQPTSGQPFGRAFDGSGGDFNLFGASPAQPDGVNYFTLAAGNSELVLRTLRQGPATVPTAACPSGQSVAIPTMGAAGKSLLILMLLGMAAVGLRRIV